MCLHSDTNYFDEEKKNHGSSGCFVTCEDCGKSYWASPNREDKYNNEGWTCEYCGGLLHIGWHKK